ncbi:MAG: hypothetical protein ACT4O9_04165 [Blastocatellia bacterium]
MKAIKTTAAFALMMSVSVPAFTQAVSEPSSTLRSYQKARAVIDRAISAHGGLDKIRALDNVSLDYEGVRTMINQSRRPDSPWDQEPASGRMVIDRKRNRMYALNFTSYPGIGRFGGEWAIDGNEGFHWEPAKNHHGSEIMMKMTGVENDGTWAFIPRWMPPFLVLAAAENNNNLRWVDAFERNGRSYEAVSFVQRDRGAMVAIFDKLTGLLDGFESIRDHPVYGDVTDFVRFSEYVDIGGVKFPNKRTDFFNGTLERELKMKFAINGQLDDKLFRVPDGYSQPSNADTGPRIKKIGDGVYIDQEMGGVMAVEFKDFIVMVECPGNFWMSRSTIEAVKAAIPNKPIRYVVPSHTHGDHGGGARGYYHIGATLITTPGNVTFYQRLSKIRQTVRPDPYSSTANPPIIETFQNKRVITDGDQTLELHDLGPNPHSEELIFAYLPKQKIVWQSDIIFNPMTGGGINKAMPIGVEFGKRLKALGITDFETMVESHHSRVITVADFRRGLSLAGFNDF